METKSIFSKFSSLLSKGIPLGGVLNNKIQKIKTTVQDEKDKLDNTVQQIKTIAIIIAICTILTLCLVIFLVIKPFLKPDNI